jgi:hypothetical protein
MIESRNIGRTRSDFQCRVRIINGLFAPWRFQAKRGPGSPEKNASELEEQLQWQQVAVPHKKRPAQGRPFLNLGNSGGAEISTR